MYNIYNLLEEQQVNIIRNIFFSGIIILLNPLSKICQLMVLTLIVSITIAHTYDDSMDLEK